MLSPAMITFSNLPKISQISSVENQRMSQPRGIYGASWPMRPPEDKAAKSDAREEQRGAKAECRSREEILHVLRYL